MRASAHLRAVAQSSSMREALASRLAGVWSLVSYTDEQEGCDASFPFGPEPVGFLIYTPDGFVSAQLMPPGRPLFQARDWHAGTPAEYQQAGSGYIAYCGVYKVDEKNKTVTHIPFVADLMLIRARAVLVEARTMLVNAARGFTKSYGERLPSCGTGRVREELTASLSEPLQNVLKPLLAEVASVSERIQENDEQIENTGKSRYPETALLKQVHGVGTLTALTYMLTVEDPYRFRRGRDAGAYFGLRPGRRESGDSRPQLRITKEGDAYVRKLLVQCAHHILGPFGQDSDLRRWGWELASRGGKNAKKRALVAVARKLAVLLHKLWVSGEVYEPLHVRRGGKTVAA